MKNNSLNQIIDFIKLVENLKIEKRNSLLSNNERETVAAHSWRVSLMAILFEPYFPKPLNREKILKMAIIHDLTEAVVGDMSYEIYEKNPLLREKRSSDELEAIKKIAGLLPIEVSNEIFELWNDFEKQVSDEAKFIQALDKIEAQIQDNQTDIVNWSNYEYESSLIRLDEYCNFDQTLLEIKKIVRSESIKKMSISSK